MGAVVFSPFTCARTGFFIVHVHVHSGLRFVELSLGLVSGADSWFIVARVFFFQVSPLSQAWKGFQVVAMEQGRCCFPYIYISLLYWWMDGSLDYNRCPSPL